MKKLLVLLLLLSMLLMACSGDKAKEEGKQNTEKEKQQEKKEEQKKPQEPVKTPKEQYESLAKGEIYSPLNGKKVAEDVKKQRPLCVMFDNYYHARPQASLEMADIMYEILVEGQITRYMGVFQSQEPALIGPVRSARPYFLRLALEYDAYYTHVGGSEAAKSDIRTLKIPDIDGLSAPDEVLWREKHRKAPHNTYGSFQSITGWADKMKYRKDYELKSWKFGYESGNKEFQKKAHEFKIIYKEPVKGDEIGYFSGFKYDKEKDHYLRFVNGEPHVDEVSKEQLKASSIIVQRATTKVLDNAGRLSVNLVTDGEGYYFHNGVMEPITWKKDSDSDRTMYYTKDSKELVFFPGVIWVQVIPTYMDIATPEGEVIRFAAQ